MDEITHRAKQYFLEFEARHLYPSLLSWYWSVWFVIAIAFGVFAYFGLVHAGRSGLRYERALMLASEIAFLVSCFVIGAYKNKRVQDGAPKSPSKRHAYMDKKRRVALERICGVDASRFASAAKECSDLIAMRKIFRFVSDASIGDILRNVYEPDSKARILSLLLSAAAIFVALLNHSVPAEDFNILGA